MKKIIVSAGLVAAGAAGFQSSSLAAGGLDVVSPKAWNVSATLRGFYDDNYNIGASKQGSGGVELSPSVSFNLPLQQTDIGFKYTYGLYYYQQRQDLGINAVDQTHQFDLWLDHAFNERWKTTVSDTVAVGQEPELLNSSPSAPSSVPYRVNGNNFANHASIALDTEWTRQFSTELRYANHFYDYQNTGATLAGPVGSEFLVNGASLAGLLSRDEQNIALDFQWHIQAQTVGFVGYQLSLVNYVGNEPIAVFNTIAPSSLVYKSNSRDNLTHYGYVGVQHQFTANLGGTVRGGVSYTDNYNDPLNSTSSLAPYADLSLTYTYLPGSYVQLGFTHDVNATDIVAPDSGGRLTQYQESSVVYVDVNHTFYEKLVGTLIGRYQYSDFKDGAFSASGDTDYSLGVNLSYLFNHNFSADIGYNYDNLQSGIAGRGYGRNRVYLGLTATY